ncbi:hypothetical protein JX265_002601 [Neoarthrinium moseri]|uniref:Uncharacterized protein n=1 Tax=Neoarthrinium moseri TaxID=1658444 RepID=A0A9P9WV62_9PEZI|nr:hypothetical protein JX265_002601 [Neoarthrinium moseri]
MQPGHAAILKLTDEEGIAIRAAVRLMGIEALETNVTAAFLCSTPGAFLVLKVTLAYTIQRVRKQVTELVAAGIVDVTNENVTSSSLEGTDDVAQNSDILISRHLLLAWPDTSVTKACEVLYEFRPD